MQAELEQVLLRAAAAALVRGGFRRESTMPLSSFHSGRAVQRQVLAGFR